MFFRNSKNIRSLNLFPLVKLESETCSILTLPLGLCLIKGAILLSMNTQSPWPRAPDLSHAMLGVAISGQRLFFAQLN